MLSSSEQGLPLQASVILAAAPAPFQECPRKKAFSSGKKKESIRAMCILVSPGFPTNNSVHFAALITGQSLVCLSWERGRRLSSHLPDGK